MQSTDYLKLLKLITNVLLFSGNAASSPTSFSENEHYTSELVTCCLESVTAFLDIDEKRRLEVTGTPA